MVGREALALQRISGLLILGLVSSSQWFEDMEHGAFRPAGCVCLKWRRHRAVAVLSYVFKGANPHGRTASGYIRRSVCQPAGINEEGTNLMPHIVHQRPMQTFSREAGAFNTRRLLQSGKDLPAELGPLHRRRTHAPPICVTASSTSGSPTCMKLSASLSSQQLQRSAGLCTVRLKAFALVGSRRCAGITVSLAKPLRSALGCLQQHSSNIALLQEVHCLGFQSLLDGPNLAPVLRQCWHLVLFGQAAAGCPGQPVLLQAGRHATAHSKSCTTVCCHAVSASFAL